MARMLNAGIYLAIALISFAALLNLLVLVHLAWRLLYRTHLPWPLHTPEPTLLVAEQRP